MHIFLMQGSQCTRIYGKSTYIHIHIITKMYTAFNLLYGKNLLKPFSKGKKLVAIWAELFDEQAFNSCEYCDDKKNLIRLMALPNAGLAI